jgi:putative membrane protein
VADEGINSKVEQSVWDKISSDMTNHFKLSNFKEGIIYAINEIGDLLSREFPPSDTMKNELPNEVIIE